MLRFRAERFVVVSREIGRLSQVLEREPPDKAREDRLRENDAKALERYRNEFVEIHLSLSERQVKRIIDRCRDKEKQFTNREMREMVSELVNRVHDECEQMHVMCLTTKEKDWYEPESPIVPKAVTDKLPAIAEDIDEAAKCFALNRSTACVFHLMRVMELGVQHLGSALGVNLVSEKNWQNILDETNKAIKALDHRQDGTKALAEVSSHLYGVKVAWRNEVMHPKQTYTPDEAEAIFMHVRSFINELAGVV